MKRYLSNSIGSMVSLIFLFLLIFFGINAFLGNSFNSESKESLILSYMVWLISLSVYQTMSTKIDEELKQGTIEQLYMSKYSLRTILIVQTIAELVIEFLQIILVVILCMLITNTWLNFSNIFSILGLLLIILVNYFGISLFLSGLVLYVKRMAVFMQIMQFVFLGILLINTENSILLKLIPTAYAINLLNDVVVSSAPVVINNFFDASLLLVPTIIYFIIGYLFFGFMEKFVVKKAKLGFY